MNKFIRNFLALVVLGLTPAFGQTILTNTTLSAAVTGTSTQILTLTSATGVTAANPTNPSLATFLIVDAEMVSVTSVSGTQVQVVRGVNGTGARLHASGAIVIVLPAYLGTNFTSIPPTGSCTRGNIIALPRVSVSAGLAKLSDCLGGQWVNGDSGQTTRAQPNSIRYPDPGGTAYTALQTSGTAPAANTQIECSEVDVPYSNLLTGIGILNGTTVGTDNHWVILYDATGNVIANSAAAGAVTATASVYQKYAFTAKYYLVGPERLFACYGSNGTTDTVRHAVTGTNDNILGGAVTGQVFGTAAAITVPTTFTTAKVPYFILY